MFGLDPQSIVARAQAHNLPVRPPSLRESVLRGVIGFTLVSIGGFAPWVLAGRWFHRNTGEMGLYVVCALVFIGLSGPLLHRLIIGPGSLLRFYQIFSLAFAGYATAWTVGWMAFRGVTGSIAGALAGIAVMGAIFTSGFAARGSVLKVFVVLFAANVAGYFIGEWTYNLVLSLKEGNSSGLVLSASARSSLSKTLWGLWYGVGFGAGIGLAFHFCQTEARRRLHGGD